MKKIEQITKAFSLQRVERFEIEMPKGSKILCASAKKRDLIIELSIYILADPSLEKEVRYFKQFPTDFDLHDDEEFDLEFVYSYEFWAHGSIVWHLFEMIKK